MDQINTSPILPPPPQPQPTTLPASVPIWAKLISILFYIAAIFYLFAAFITSTTGKIFGVINSNAGFAIGLLAAVFFAWSILHSVAGGGLWRGKQWAKILVVAIAVLNSIYEITILFHKHTTGNYFLLLINVLIILYLFLDKRIAIATKPLASKNLSVALPIIAIVVFVFIYYPNLIPSKLPSQTTPTANCQSLPSTSSGQLDQIAKNNCFSAVATSNKDISECNLIQDSFTQMNCITNVAVANKNPEQCKLIQSQEQQTSCLANIAVAEKNSTACSSLASQLEQDNCATFAAQQLKDPSFCQNVSTTLFPNNTLSYRDQCYSEVARALEAPSACNNINNQGQASCYAQIAVDKKDTSICKQITNSDWKNLCLSWGPK